MCFRYATLGLAATNSVLKNKKYNKSKAKRREEKPSAVIRLPGSGGPGPARLRLTRWVKHSSYCLSTL